MGSVTLMLTPAEDFALATRYGGEPPRDEHVTYVGRTADGEVAHFRWRVHPDLDDEQDDPYWARLDTDEIFEAVEWAPSSMDGGQIAKLYS